MEDAPLPIIQTPKEEHKESFEIKQQEKNYKLNINIINQEIILNILDEKDLMKEYEIKLTFDELKIIHKIFLTFNSCKDFIDFIKASVENKKMFIKRNKENQMTIEFMVEYLFKQNIIRFDLNQKKMNLELSIQDLYQKFINISEICKNLIEENKNIKEDNIILKQENQKLNERVCILEEKIKIIENENMVNKKNNFVIQNNAVNKDLVSLKMNKLNLINSTIMEKNEFDMIYSAIKERMNKEIKEIKKLYQATKDGGDSETFHKLCDGISNTLVLYKSAGNRRFGGFASLCWNSESGPISDKNCFLFSLDKKKIYYSKIGNFQIADYSYDGPSFASEKLYIIRILGNALKEKTLGTAEEEFKDIFDGDQNALSEDGKCKGIYAKEYEVFQIIFE